MSQTETPNPQLGLNALLSSEIAVGHCINVNQVEQPCGRLIAVITSVKGDMVGWKYLSAEPCLDSYNTGRGCWSYFWEVTPVSDFGVEVRIDGDKYWCEPIGESRAKYKDGSHRDWQERGVPYRCTARPDVMRVATSG
jgi:hypothetical protein